MGDHALQTTIFNKRLFLHELFAFKKRFKPSSPNFKKLTIPYLLCCDLAWWNALLPKFNKITLLCLQRLKISLYSDACNTGLRAIFYENPQTISQSPLTQKNSYASAVKEPFTGQHINVLELLAIQASL
jgi:hypothetical protein